MERTGILRAGCACIWLVNLLAFMAPPAARAGEFDPIYASDFSSPDTLAQSWSITSGSWQVTNNELRNSSTVPLSIASVPNYDTGPLPHDSIGGDLTLDVYLAIGSSAAGARAGAVFEFTDASNFHEVTLSPTGSVQLRSRVAGVVRVVATATTTAPGANKWVHLTLVRATHRTTVRIDGMRVFDNELQDGLQGGDIGVLTRGTSARFDDLNARSFAAQSPTLEDFNDRVATRWEPLSGAWSAQSQVYINSAVVPTAITRGPFHNIWDADRAPFPVPYTFKVRMLNPYGGSGNLVGLAWVRDDRNYTEAVFSPTGEARLNQVVNGVRNTLAAAQYLGGGANKWFEVEVEHDANLPPELAVKRIKVNGVPVFDTAPELPGNGALSLITHWAPGRFDDIRAAPRFFRPVAEDFDDLSAPQIRRGAWSLADGMLSTSRVFASDEAFIDDPGNWHELADIELRARMINRFANAGNLVGFTYGARASVYYEAVFSPTGVAHLRKVVKGTPITIATASYEGGERNQWFDAQLIQIGERTTVKVNGVAVFENVLQPDALGGGLGFVAHWTNASIDDVLFAQIPSTRYRLTPLANLGGEFTTNSFVQALNDRGDVVGASLRPNGTNGAVLWRGGAVTDLNAGASADALGINNKTEIVGRTVADRAFIWRDGVVSDLGTSPDTAQPRSQAWDINDRGQIVGSSCGGRDCPALMWKPDGTIVVLEDLPGGIVWGDAFAINEAGEAVGQSALVVDNMAAASWQGGTVEPLATEPGGKAVDINNRGQIVGVAPIDREQAVIWLDREMLSLPELPGLPQSQARGINEHGVIVGWNTRLVSPPFEQSRAVIWQEGGVYDLNDRIVCGALPASIVLAGAEDVNERGQIAVNAIDLAAEPIHNDSRAYLLTPVSPQDPCQ